MLITVLFLILTVNTLGKPAQVEKEVITQTLEQKEPSVMQLFPKSLSFIPNRSRSVMKRENTTSQ